MIKDILNGRKKLIIIGTIAFLVILLGSIFIGLYVKGNIIDNLDFEIIAQNSSDLGIDVDTKFLITSKGNYSAGAVKKIISLEPNMDFSLEKVSSNNYLLTPSEKFNDSSIYNIYLSSDGKKIERSWAFQTKTEFKVNSTSPRDESVYVDKNSGIEINFSKPVDNIEGYLTISPDINGSIEYKGKRVIFKPDNLEFDTPYKVTVKKGLKSIYGEELADDFSFSFRVERSRNTGYFSLVDGYQRSFISDELCSVRISCDDKYFNSEFNANIYKLSSLEEYLNFLEIHDKEVDDKVGYDTDYIFDMTNYPIYENFSAKVIPDPEVSWLNILQFPNKLPVGWYIADFSNGEVRFQKPIQVSDISVLTYGLGNRLEVWCADSENGNLLAGATVKVGELAAITDSNGIASFNINNTDKEEIYITSKDGKKFGEYIKVINKEEETLIDDYYTYLYTDRGRYFSTDTVNFWGTIIPKKSKVKMPNEVIVLFGENEIKVNVNSDGTFMGKYEFSNNVETTLPIYLKLGEKTNYMNYVEVSDYIKPTYKLSANFEKDYYRGSEAALLNIYGKFYDGSLASNLKLDVESGDNQQNRVVLNADGEGTLKIYPSDKAKDGYMEYLHAAVKVSGIDEYAECYANAPYFPTDYYLDTSWDSKNSTLNFSTNKVNYDAINGKYINDEKLYTGESFNQEVIAEVIEIETIKNKTGESYNYYTGMIEPTYSYETVERVIRTSNISVYQNQTSKFEVPEVNNNLEFNYKIRCNFILPDGYEGNREVYVYKYNNYSYDNLYFSRNDEYKALKLGESTVLSVNDMASNSSMIYFVSTDRVCKLGVTGVNNFKVTMEEELIPNCLVSGAVFDGKRIREVSSTYLYYNTTERELDIEITTDKEKYSPGETVNANFLVKDKTGKGVKATLLASAVDEATLNDSETISPIDKLYETRYHKPYITVSNYEYKFEGGEGGGDGIRDDFRNVILFESITTDENGRASVSFKTSDDLTSWNINAIGVTKNAYIGRANKNITTSIPFFINQVINAKYTINDDFTFSARAFGNSEFKLKSNNVEYEASIEGIDTKKSSLPPSDTAMFNFGKLPLGKYKVKVTAKSGELFDGIEKEIEVTESLYEVNTTKLIDISKITELQVTRYPAKVILFDRKNGVYYRILNKVLEQSIGEANEQIFSRNYVYDKLNEFLGEKVYDADLNLTLQDYSGGISNFTYKDADPLITANVCMISPNMLNSTMAKEYFYEIVNNVNSTPYDVSAAYMGLAALREPVLNDIRYLVNNSEGFELIDKINLLSSIAYIGDYDLATKYYNKEIKGIMTQNNEYIYISDDYESLTYKANSRLVSALSIIGHDDFMYVLNYVLDNYSNEYISSLDLLVASMKYQPNNKANSYIEYEINGQKLSTKFSKKNLEIIELSEDEFKNFKIIKKKGDIDALISYVGKVDKSDDSVSIKKEITPGKLGEYSTVTLTLKFNDDARRDYLITDIVPIASRYTSSGSYSNWYGNIDAEGQKLKIYVTSNGKEDVTISYKIRNLLSGKYMAESTFITDFKGRIVGKSNDLIFEVK